MGRLGRTAAAIVGVAAALAIATPVAQADEVGIMHYSCGQTRPPNLDGSAFVAAEINFYAKRGSSVSCGNNGYILEGDKLDYYCWTRGNDGATWTYLSAYERGIAGWVDDFWLGHVGSLVHCPI